MGQIDSGSKSNRLLASRRYTHNTFNTAQESFTNVLDLRSEEIFTRAHLIPSSSLPHSGSSQKGATFTKNGQTVTKYWYRHKLTKSNTNNEVWFFLNPTGSDDGVGAQLINDNQQTSFISPKYSTSALANATTEDATPGYLALVYKSTATNTSSLDGDDIVSTNDYQFDYKTGVLQFRSSTVDPTDSQYLYMSVYQYVGQNLRTGLEIEGPFTASNMSFGGDVTGSSTSTGSFGQVFVGDRLVFKDHQDSGEYIESDGTDLSINVGANGDINIPANIGMTFGNDGEKIEGDGTDLTISGNNIKLTADTDVIIPTNVGLHFTDSAEKIESDGTDLTINAGADINLTAVADVNIPSGVGVTFGNDGEKIEGDGTDLTVASSNDLNLTATTDINIPANVGLTFGNDGEKIEGDGTDMTIASSGVLTLSSTGNTLVETVTFNNGNVTIPGDLTVTGDRIEAQVGSLQVADHTITVGSGSDSSALMQNGGIDWGVSGSVAFLRYRHAGTAISSSAFLEAPKLTVDTITIDAAEIDATGALDIDTGGDLTLSATGDVNIPANIGLTFGNDGEKIEGDATDLTIASSNKLNLTATTDIHVPVNVGVMFGTHEKIESDDTDLSITVGSGGDINIPADIGLTFGDDGEKIEGDGTDLTISGNKIKLDSTMVTGSSTTTGSFAHGYFASKIGINETAPAEALEVIGNISGSGTGSFHHTLTRQRAYLFDAGGEYLLGDGTDLTIASGQDLNLTATTDINIPSGVGLTFGNDGEKIEGDGTDLTIAGNIINLSPTADVVLPNDKGIQFGGASEKIEGDGTDLTITGAKINLSPTTDVHIPNDKGVVFGDDGEKIEGDGTDLTIASSNDLNLTATTDINIPANVGLTFGDDAEKIEGDGTNLTISANKILLDSAVTSGSSVSTGSFGRLELAGNLSAPSTGTGSFGLIESTTHIATTVESATFACFGLISGSSISTGSFGRLVVDNGNTQAFIIDNAKVSGSSITTGSFGRLELAGNANINGNITLGGSINIGDAAGDDIVLGGEIKSNIIPDADATYDLGSSSKGWNDLHLGSGGVINLDGGDVTLTHSSNLVTITGGSTRVDKLEIDGANDHIDVSTDMVLTAAADITLTPGGANVKPGSDSAIDLGVSGTAFRELFVDAIDLNGQGSISVGGTGRIDLDGDDDTSIRASADDVITFEAGAVDIAQMTATQAISGSSIATGSFSYVHVSSKVSGSSVSTGSFGRLEVGGNTNLTGNITIGGNMTLGDADSDSISISADLTSNLIPNADNTFDLGSSAKQWKDIYVNGIGYIDQLGTDGDAVAAYISSGEIDGTVIGGESAAAATFTTVTTSGNVSGSSVTTGSFGRVQTSGNINTKGRVFENDVSVIDHATAMAIVFGG
tara:strand:+ start:729 stop:4895 length:4167 start_codon:yes stop_codon:yes gene_type:complete